MVAGAVGDGEQSATYADRSGDGFWRMGSRTTHANALHQAGRRAEAEARFREAEHMQSEGQRDYPLLYSLPGFRYCDLLLTEAERAVWQHFLSLNTQLLITDSVDACHSVSERVTQIFQWRRLPKWNPAFDSLLHIALDHLTLGRAALYAAILSNSEIESSKSEIDLAVDGVRHAGQQQYFPLALLSSAVLRIFTDAHIGAERAQIDLDDAWEIAERSPMPLHMADIHLHRARLFFREPNYPWESPQKDLAEARRLIKKCGYWRRKEELEDAEEAILGKAKK